MRLRGFLLSAFFGLPVLAVLYVILSFSSEEANLIAASCVYCAIVAAGTAAGWYIEEKRKRQAK